MEEIKLDKSKTVQSFWFDVAKQNTSGLKEYFTQNAVINWHNTNERFTVEEYIIANCEYPGCWNGKVERFEILDNLVITVAKVWTADETMVLHATSFFEFTNDKITVLNEYWGDDGTAPQWRLDKHIGKPIKDK